MAEIIILEDHKNDLKFLQDKPPGSKLAKLQTLNATQYFVLYFFLKPSCVIYIFSYS